MKPQNVAKRHDYTKLGEVLKNARNTLYKQTGHKPSVEDMAKKLSVTKGFVYQVEQGKRKPKYGALGRWASVYGVPPNDLLKCLHLIPFNFVATLREEPKPAMADPFSQLTEDEKSELLPFLDYVRWKIAHTTQQIKTFGSIESSE